MHRLRRVPAGMPGRGDLFRRRGAREVPRLYSGERGLLQEWRGGLDDAGATLRILARGQFLEVERHLRDRRQRGTLLRLPDRIVAVVVVIERPREVDELLALLL